MNRIFKTISFLTLLLIFNTPKAQADDIGITSVRLIQVTDSSYIFEADIIQQAIWAIRAPVFPKRFNISKMEYTDNAGWIIARVTVTTNGDPLNYKDEIFLPWMRNGVSLTAQWKDGTLGRGFFRRSLDGIHIPMNVLIPVEKTNMEIASESLILGLKHIGIGFIHLLFVIAIFLISRGKSVFIYLLWYAFGQGFSLILIEFGIPGFDMLFTELLILLVALILAVSTVKNKSFNYLSWVLLLLGLFHGLSANQALEVLKPDYNQHILAVFMFDLAVDAFHFGFALLFIPIYKRLEGKNIFVKTVTYFIGIVSVALIFGIFNQKVLRGETAIVKLEESENVIQKTLPTNQGGQPTADRPPGAVRLTTPIMSYLSVEPFEVRHEILVNAGTALELIDMLDTSMGSVPEETQELVKKQILDLFEKSNPILIDGANSKPVQTQIDFVTLGPTGVFIRPEPIRESLEEGIIGITMIYETETLAKDISINWNLFTENLDKIEATTVDPFGGGSFMITPEDNILGWKQTLSGYTVPKVEEIAIEQPPLPVVSFLLILAAIALLILFRKKYIKMAVVLVGVALLAYPFLRFSMNIAMVNQWKPSEERSAKIIDGLLTNVYRSFDYRNEEAVYDRLAISVMGDQLVDTYIEQRKGLEIENRGGASAKVDDVDVLEIYDVVRGENGDYGIETSWTINGSVSHFGHMHYRQNSYRAIIWIVPNEDNWKIREMEIIEETRLL